MKLLQLKNIPIFEQLKLEEALLRADEGNWCLINEGSPPAVVMGISGKIDELVYTKEVHRQQIPIIRRYSGGGTVVVDEETLFISFIGNHHLLPGPCFPEPLMRWAETILAKAIPELKLKENDFVIGKKKVAGNAQYIRKRRFCHHLTLLWDYSLERMGCLKLPNRTPAYRKQRDHDSFLTKLKDYIPTKKAFLKDLEEHLLKSFTCKHVSLEEARASLHLPHRKSTKKVRYRGE